MGTHRCARTTVQGPSTSGGSDPIHKLLARWTVGDLCTMNWRSADPSPQEGPAEAVPRAAEAADAPGGRLCPIHHAEPASQSKDAYPERSSLGVEGQKASFPEDMEPRLTHGLSSRSWRSRSSGPGGSKRSCAINSRVCSSSWSSCRGCQGQGNGSGCGQTAWTPPVSPLSALTLTKRSWR
ncbi:max dimerization protein 3 isoform X2 [Cavia porcellus]|uniref:max dimerization protein 3 isoform X2 n=1 Tax=Cavia porcellus TaxID=10141 RepID=UPI000661F1C9